MSFHFCFKLFIEFAQLFALYFHLETHALEAYLSHRSLVDSARIEWLFFVCLFFLLTCALFFFNPVAVA